MRAVIQRCRGAEVRVVDVIVGQIEQGLTMFVGVAAGDDVDCVARLAAKVEKLRIFDDDDGKFNLSLRDVGGQLLVISNFTVYADARKGTRPNFVAAAPAEQAEALYLHLVEVLRGSGLTVATGTFGAHMRVTVDNDGPVTLVMDVPPAGALTGRHNKLPP